MEISIYTLRIYNTYCHDYSTCGGTYRDHWEKNGIPVTVMPKYTDTHIHTHPFPPPTPKHTCNTHTDPRPTYCL